MTLNPDNDLRPKRTPNPFFTILIPAHNESLIIEETVTTIYQAFLDQSIAIEDFEFLIINDHSNDQTEKVLQNLMQNFPNLFYLNNERPSGFGHAVCYGLDHFQGETVCIVMADLSDTPHDILTYFHLLKEGKVDAIFGSRFINGSKLIDYPLFKFTLNRIINNLLRLLFWIPYNDTTNAFKGYHRKVIEGVAPLVSRHFNLTVELPLKTIIRGFSYQVIPISWYNRKKGYSKFHLQEMGSRYLFSILYVWLEKLLTRGDYHKD